MYSLIQCYKVMFADLNKSSDRPRETSTLRISVPHLNLVDHPVQTSAILLLISIQDLQNFPQSSHRHTGQPFSENKNIWFQISHIQNSCL